ncbi:hypothetical protein VNO78_06520 [Psophocarpus tetragonolobus]|uniref:Uncharacterized protein n=1 Tax=Psophocarpus tetragonolobus TaxID=3891 RepID=A0AAN9XRN3_PSOTE
MRKIAPMALEDEIPKCNNGGEGGGRKGVGRPSKIPKPKKVPQRGLGVAQLERIRLEEEQKEKAEAAAATTIGSSSSSNSPYDMHLKFMKLHQSNQPPSSNSLPSSTVSFANNSGGSNACWHSVPVQGRVSGPHNRVPPNFQFHKNNFGTNPRLPVESKPIGHLPNWLQVNVSLGASSTIMHRSSLESPLNLDYNRRYSFKKHKEKMTGIKRPSPFSLDMPPVSSSNFKPLTFPATMKASEKVPCRSGRGFNLDFTNSTIREIPSPPASNSQMISKKNKKESKKFVGDFLSLSPPAACSRSKLNSPTFSPFHHQGNMKDQVPPPSGYNQINQQQHWNNFSTPTTMVAQTGQQPNRSQNQSVKGKNIDLDLTLKL